MDYEKTYKESLEKCRWMLADGKISKESATELFRELKEITDIEIIEMISSIIASIQFPDEGVPMQMACLKWLEKQGEQKPILPIWKYKKDNTPLLRDSLILNKYGCVAKSPSGALVSDVWVIDYDELAKLPKEESEKQGEQKPADKVEPKFREGDSIQFKGFGHNRYTIKEVCGLSHYINTMGSRMDMSYTDANFEVIKDSDKVEPKFHKGEWVTNSTETVQINGYDIDYGYQVDYKGNLQHRDPDVIEKEYHLWTIRDAKDGDVLYTPKGCGVEGISLIKGWKQVDGTGRTLCSDIGYRVEDDEIIAGGLGAIWWEGVVDPFYPATKEQRDLLFKKMKEAGYEWDAEKKELKKLEPKCDTCTNDKGCVTCVDGDQWEGKPAEWSEEDERLRRSCIAHIEDELEQIRNDKYGHSEIISDLKESCRERIKWLKSLKDRCTWKKSLATADLENSLCDIQDGYPDTSYEYRILGEAIEFIRCTEPHWKPSKEQIVALRWVLNNIPYNKHKEEISGLLDQIKEYVI